MNSVKPAVCAHCGLPVYDSRGKEPAYCCTGCVIVAAMLGSAQQGERAETRQSRGLLLRLGLAAFFSANVMVLSISLYTGEAPALAVRLVNSLLLVLSAPVFVLLAPPFVAGLARDLRRRRPSTDSLIAIGTTAAFVYSAISVFRGSTAVYFDTATMVLLLVTVGRLLESNARLKGRRAVEELMALQPRTVRVWRDGGWKEAARGRSAGRGNGAGTGGGADSRGWPHRPGGFRRGRIDADGRAAAGGKGERGHGARRVAVPQRGAGDRGFRRLLAYIAGSDHRFGSGSSSLAVAHGAAGGQSCGGVRARRGRPGR